MLYVTTVNEPAGRLGGGGAAAGRSKSCMSGACHACDGGAADAGGAAGGAADFGGVADFRGAADFGGADSADFGSAGFGGAADFGGADGGEADGGGAEGPTDAVNACDGATCAGCGTGPPLSKRPTRLFTLPSFTSGAALLPFGAASLVRRCAPLLEPASLPESRAEGGAVLLEESCDPRRAAPAEGGSFFLGAMACAQ